MSRPDIGGKEIIGELAYELAAKTRQEVKSAHHLLEQCARTILKGEGKRLHIVPWGFDEKGKRIIQFVARPPFETTLEAYKAAEEIGRGWLNIQQESTEPENIGDFSRTEQPREE